MKRIVFFLTSVATFGVAYAAPDDDFLAVREAFRVGDPVKFEHHAINLQGYTLSPYVEYWRFRMHLSNATPDQVHALLARIDGTVAADKLRSDWLKLLAMRRQWEQFDAEYPAIVEADPELACFALQSKLRDNAVNATVAASVAAAATDAAQMPAASDGADLTPTEPALNANENANEDATADASATPPPRETALQAAKELWFTGHELPDACDPVFNTLIKQSRLNVGDVWARIRLALEAGNTSVARSVAEDYLPNSEGKLDRRTLSSIAVNPQRYLNQNKFDLKTRAGRETMMFAVYRLARTSAAHAATRWQQLGAHVSEDDRRYVWGLIAAQGAQQLDPNTLAWFDQAGILNDNQLAWKVRVQLRTQNWNEVLANINAMTPNGQNDPAWRYWKARALTALKRGDEAKAILVPLSSEANFYGQLAAEDLGNRRDLPQAYHPSEQEIADAGTLPGIQRALTFYRLNLRFEGTREWNWTVSNSNLTDKQLLAAAEYAQRNELYDRAIYTAEQTKQLHDYGLRYPTPYRDLLSGYVAQQKLDEAWVYGLIRQESRFITIAHSSAGANGLMQLMPKTAKFAARSLGMHNYRRTQISDVDTNLNLGTWYLRRLLDELDSHMLLASAGYNAGPRRAMNWRGTKPMEGAVYAETIPFRETRDYVKKVMSGATFYSKQLGITLQSLRDRLGVVMPVGGNDTLINEEDVGG